MSDAIPLPPRPNLEQYRRQAKELLKACRSNAVRAWATRWIASWSARWLETQAVLRGTEVGPGEVRGLIDRVDLDVRAAKITRLADAQFYLARAHGFDSWPKFVKHIQSPDANFEAAADAIVEGELATLQRLLREDPSLIHRRSSRTHRSTLLHYVSANGVEDFRQKTAANVVAIARLLLDSGADANAESAAYGGHSTTFGLVATSVHPERAGVQLALMELLLARGARIDSNAIAACVVNGRLDAARFLAARGEPLDLVAAAGVGRADAVAGLLDDGADPATSHGGLTAMHWAAHHGHLDVIRVFIAHNAPLEVENRYGGTVLGQAVWSSINDPQPDHPRIIEALVAAGARVGDDWFTGRREIDEALGRTRPASARPDDRVRELKHLARIAHNNGDLDQAVRLYEQAVALCRDLGDPLLLAHTLRHLGDVHQDTEHRRLAEPLYAEALAIYRANDETPPLDLANAIRSYAIAREEAGALDEAIELWEEAHQLYLATNVPPGVEETARRLARIRAAR